MIVGLYFGSMLSILDAHVKRRLDPETGIVPAIDALVCAVFAATIHLSFSMVYRSRLPDARFQWTTRTMLHLFTAVGITCSAIMFVLARSNGMRYPNWLVHAIGKFSDYLAS